MIDYSCIYKHLDISSGTGLTSVNQTGWGYVDKVVTVAGSGRVLLVGLRSGAGAVVSSTRAGTDPKTPDGGGGECTRYTQCLIHGKQESYENWIARGE